MRSNYTDTKLAIVCFLISLAFGGTVVYVLSIARHWSVR